MATGPTANPLSGRSVITRSAGPVGAAYARCSQCKAENYAKRDFCLRCKSIKPKDIGTRLIRHNWREALDPNTKQIYYYNTKTRETTWTRPKEMGYTVYNTGWFGRGNSGTNYKELYESNNLEYLSRPAMKQAEKLAKRSIAYREGGHEFNIWYNRYAGDSLNNEQSFEPADSRLKVKLHSGYTKADQIQDKEPNKKLYFCIWFARGKCAKGVDCTHFHRLPTYADVGRLEKDMLHDCFGRERHATQRSDMDGVGSFNDPSRTLYIGHVQRAPYMDNPKSLREALFKHFLEFGEVENVNVIWRLSIAFVRFRFRTHAEFAKVAMAQQGLDHNEVLVLRWAYDDPNPTAKEAIKRANADAVVTSIAAVSGDKSEEQPLKRKKIIGPQMPKKKRNIS